MFIVKLLQIFFFCVQRLRGNRDRSRWRVIDKNEQKGNAVSQGGRRTEKAGRHQGGSIGNRVRRRKAGAQKSWFSYTGRQLACRSDMTKGADYTQNKYFLLELIITV
ncbi:hypothetical protein [Janthinobacterium sp. RB2R34]|uniref:hypothetical protein n=1 Tax=Janthinobacterium sp. RB2R34 TaxID=3424193 RepID=UPI003F2502CF